MGYILSTNKKCLVKPLEFWQGAGVYYYQNKNNFQKHPGFFLEGYLRQGHKSISTININLLKTHWPLPDDFSGSFAFSLITETEIIIANDSIGIYPLYYLFDDSNFSVSNSLIDLQKALNLEIDEVGKAQRLFAPENSEIGSRTLLNGVKRLLPGEKIVYNLKTKSLHKNYDNRLYENIHNNIQENEVQNYWQILVDEIKFIESLNNTPTDIALSGGLDSRMLIGAMTPKSDTIAYHYGKPEYYETKIAKRIAEKCGFQFKAGMDYANQFPEKKILQKTIEEVSPPYSMNWYNIFDMAKSHKTNLILGDMCEAIHGRNIKTFTTRKSRMQNYFKHYVLNKDYRFTPANKQSFEDWKIAKIKSYWDYIRNESLIEQTKFEIKDYKDHINQDLEEIFKRIADHQVPYAELYDELFIWYTHSRIPMGRQITHCNERFFAFAPSMSSALLIATSNIHPNLRLNYRFQNKLFRQIKAFKKLNLIPTSQVPIMSKKTPDFLQFFMWGIRSIIDQILIKRVLRKKDPLLRYRLFKSLNWVKVYQYEFMNKRLNSYFENKNIPDDIIEAWINLALSRNKLEEWPLANYDIMSIAVLNLELELLKKISK